MRRFERWKGLPAAAALLAVLALPAHAQMVFDGNILWNNYSNGVLMNTERTAAQPAGFTSTDLFNHFAYNDSLDPQLADPYRRQDPNGIPPSFVPAESSPASGRNNEVVDPVQYPRECDNFTCTQIPDWAKIEKVCYRGAIPPASMGPDWTQGWTYYNDTGAGRTDIDYNKPVTIVQGHITGNVYWPNTHNYLIRGKVDVDTLSVLTIQAGTVMFGEAGSVAFIDVNMGGKIYAVGTKEQPIIFTSDQQPGNMHFGDIAGIVLNGLAIANCADCLNGQHCLTEGTTTTHCGNNDCDSSGELRYFRSEYAGHVLSPDNELNSITMCSCGINTRVEYCEAFRGLDDLFEWFGGCNTVKHIVGIGGGDDCLDTQMGYRGLVQFYVAQQWGDNGSNKGFEWDNNEFNYNAPCRNSPLAVNTTMVNCDHTTSPTAEWGAHLRRGTDGMIYNNIFIGWKKPGLYVQDNATAARGYYPQAPVFCSTSTTEPGETIPGALMVRALSPVAQQAMFFVKTPEAGPAKLGVYDLGGRLVHSYEGTLHAGTQTLSWNPSQEHMGKGTYFYRVESNGRTATGRLVLVN